MPDRADGTATAVGRSIKLNSLRIGARVAPVVGARVARVRAAQRRVGRSQRRVGGAEHLQHGLPICYRCFCEVHWLHPVIVDGVHVRAALN